MKTLQNYKTREIRNVQLLGSLNSVTKFFGRLGIDLTVP